MNKSLLAHDIEPPSRRERLQRLTTAAHRRLDERVSSLDLSREEDYCKFLQGNAGALIPIETTLERAGVDALLEDWPQRSRREFILRDLAAMSATAQPLTWTQALPKPAEMFGMLYVIEGSRLGARVLLPRVKRGAENPGVACSFLAAGGPALWRSFLDRLENAGRWDEEAMIAAACATFALFVRSFERVLSGSV